MQPGTHSNWFTSWEFQSMTSIVIYNVEKPCFTSVIGYLIDDVEVCGQITKNGYTPIKIKLLTSRQDSVDCRYYHAEGAKKAVIWVGGIGGGWDTQLRSCILTCVRNL